MTNGGISYFDVIIVIVLIIFTYLGYKRGFTVEFLRIIGTLVSLLLGVRFMSNISIVIIGATNIPPTIATIIAFSTIFIGTILIFKLVSDKTQQAIKFSIALGSADKAVGAVLGLLKGAVVVSLFAILLSVFNFSDSVRGNLAQSMLYNPMRRIAPLVYNTLKNAIPHSRSFANEFEENFSGVHYDNLGKDTRNAIEFHKKKK
jgi:membrane protein required for colicin V production